MLILRVIWKESTIFVDLSISPYISINFNFIYFEALWLLLKINKNLEFYSLELLYLSEEFNILSLCIESLIKYWMFYPYLFRDILGTNIDSDSQNRPHIAPIYSEEQSQGNLPAVQHSLLGKWFLHGFCNGFATICTAIKELFPLASRW